MPPGLQAFGGVRLRPWRDRHRAGVWSTGDSAQGYVFDYSALGDSGHMQWLVFRNSGLVSAEQYALKAADAGAEGKALGEGEFWDRFDSQRPLQRRKVFVLKCLREVVQTKALCACE